MRKSILLVVGWVILLSLAAFLLPPLDSRADVGPGLTIALTAGTFALSVCTLVVVLGYFKRSWRRVGIVPNRVDYVTWLSLQTILFTVVLVWLIKLVVPVVLRRFSLFR